MEPFRSDRIDGAKFVENAVIIKTLCTKCLKPMECHWPPEMDFAYKKCTALEYMAKVLESESMGVYCDDCLEKMPDVKLEDLMFE